VSSKRTVTDIFLNFLRFKLKTDTAYKMQFNDNYNDMKMKNVKEEESGGIHSNAFLPFSQNRLEFRYGFFVKHGRFPHPSSPDLSVAAILDACHMMKLARNTLAEYQVLIVPKMTILLCC